MFVCPALLTRMGTQYIHIKFGSKYTDKCIYHFIIIKIFGTIIINGFAIRNYFRFHCNDMIVCLKFDFSKKFNHFLTMSDIMRFNSSAYIDFTLCTPA